MDLRFRLDDRPPWPENLLFGLQWLAIALPGILIIGRVMGLLQLPDVQGQLLFVQKTCLVVALTMAVQVLWGHRLPLVAGPAAVLLVGAVASQGVPLAAIYTAILLGGLLLALISLLGIFQPLQRLFTPRIVAAVLLLIAFTLTPAILRLLLPPNHAAPLPNLLFATLLLLAMFSAYRRWRGLWRSTLIVWGLLAGTAAHLLLFGLPALTAATPPWTGHPFRQLLLEPVFEPGALFAFLFCFLALAVNDLGSIQSIGEMLKAGEMPGRVRRGISLTGLGNALSGFFGVLGPVNFSLSPGVVAATGCASRFTLLPAAALLFLLAFSPAAVALLGQLPDLVIGSVLLYILSLQVAAGLQVAFADRPYQLRDGMVLALPLLLGTIIA
ncbi:MAG: purine/pyrimidine permease, partial [Desulfuromonadales bacterium]|nr:purine/pyrimidine permease [Desulfuromonadales bacterium]